MQSNNPVYIQRLYGQWQQTGFDLLNRLAEVQYWPAVEHSYLPGAIRRWKALTEVNSIEEFETGLRKIKEEMEED